MNSSTASRRRIHNVSVTAVSLLPFVAASGCSLWQPQPAPLPVASSVEMQQLVVYSDFDLPRRHRLLLQIDALRGRVGDELDLPSSDEPIHVYLFKTPKRYRSFIEEHYPEFPDRRAFFVETDTQLSVYAYWGDRVAEDLRHEVAHGYLHGLVTGLPLWLDEGLAEYFEVDPGGEGSHAAHRDLLRDELTAGTWQPDLKRLAARRGIDEMQQIDYAEAWAWTHWSLQTTVARRQRLQQQLKDLRNGRRSAPLAQRILEDEPDAAQALVAHLLSLNATP